MHPLIGSSVKRLYWDLGFLNKLAQDGQFLCPPTRTKSGMFSRESCIPILLFVKSGNIAAITNFQRIYYHS